MITLTKIFSFETAHRISNYQGSCSNIHGHSYKLHVTINGQTNPETDIIFDFKSLKKIVEDVVISRFDHALVLKKGHTDLEGLKLFKLLLLDREPTAETMLDEMQKSIKSALPAEISLRKLTLYETESSYACWESE